MTKFDVDQRIEARIIDIALSNEQRLAGQCEQQQIQERENIFPIVESSDSSDDDDQMDDDEPVLDSSFGERPDGSGSDTSSSDEDEW